MKKVFPGQVFTAKHYDPFTGTLKVHMFVCVYTQGLDKSVPCDENCIALMITSHPQTLTRCVNLYKEDNEFLEKNSYCYCDCSYTFASDDIWIVGKLDAVSFSNVCSYRKKLLRQEDDQCVRSLMNMSIYEHRKDDDDDSSI